MYLFDNNADQIIDHEEGSNTLSPLRVFKRVTKSILYTPEQSSLLRAQALSPKYDMLFAGATWSSINDNKGELLLFV